MWIKHPRNLLAVFENEKGRNTLNVATLHRLGVGIDIQLGKEHLPLIRIAQELKNRRHIEAFASPRGTEVDDHKRLRREHFALEILITHIDQVRMAARWRRAWGLRLRTPQDRGSFGDHQIAIVLHGGTIDTRSWSLPTIPHEGPLMGKIASVVDDQIAIALHDDKVETIG